MRIRRTVKNEFVIEEPQHLDGMTFEQTNSRQYILTYKDGRTDYFDGGYITKREDRYGNKIEYFYDNHMLSKIIDSAGRNITFERPSAAELDVKVDGELVCVYKTDKCYDNRRKLSEKQVNDRIKNYYYEEHDVLVSMPTTGDYQTNTMLSLSKIYNQNTWNITSYTYDIGRDEIQPNYSSTGIREYPRITSRVDYQGLNEMLYSYEGHITSGRNNRFKVIEEVAETGVKTEYISDENKLLIEKNTIVPDGSVTIETDYTYNNKELLESYIQKISDGESERSISESYVYDDKDNIISHTDILGNTRTYQYDENTNVLTQASEPVYYNGQNTTRYTINTIDNDGNIISSQICAGDNKEVIQTINCTYDQYGNVTSRQVLPQYMATEYFTYTDNHANIDEYRKDNLRVAKYTYDNFGRKISETDAIGNTIQYKYSKNGNLVETINPDGTYKQSLYADDMAPYGIDVYLNENGPIYREEHNELGWKTDILDIREKESDLVFDNHYRHEDYASDVDKFIAVLNNTGWRTKQHINYDNIGRVISVQDENGTTNYGYDYFNRVTKITNPDGSKSQILYDDIAGTVTIIDEEGRRTTETYDIAGRKISQTIYPTDETSVTQTTEYDCNGQVISTTDYNGNTTEYEYDALGRQIAVTNALGERSTVEYADDQSYTIEYYPDGEVRLANFYNTLGQLRSTADEYFNVETFSYDGAGNMISSTDKNGNTSTYQYNSRNLLTNESKDGYSINYTYDITGKTTSISSSEQHVDGIDNNSEVSYNYLVNGLVITEAAQKFRSEDSIAFNTEYNTIDMPVSFDFDDGSSSEESVDYTLNSRNFITATTQTSQTGGNKSTGNSYYDNGLLHIEILPNGYTQEHTYDGANRLRTTSVKNGNGEIERSYAYTYDNNGNRTKIIETASDGIITETVYQYDALNRLKKEINGHSGLTTEYEFDSRNNVVTKTVSGAENYTEHFIYTDDKSDGYKTSKRIEVIRLEDDMPVKHTYYYQQPNGNTYKKIIANGFEEPLEITKYSYNANNMLTKAVVEDKQNGKTTEVLVVE